MHLLLVEDDLSLGRALLRLLERHYRVQWVRHLDAAKRCFATAEYDVMLLDLGLPDGDGVEWLRSLRARDCRTPVLIVSARDAPEDRVQGLDTGADDYLVKPFDAEELLARIRVLIRRKSGTAGPRFTVGNLSYAPEASRFFLNGAPLELPPKEHQILAALIQSGEKPVSRERLIQQLYGSGDGAGSNTLDVYVHGLRKVLGKHRIATVRGFGYRLAAR